MKLDHEQKAALATTAIIMASALVLVIKILFSE